MAHYLLVTKPGFCLEKQPTRLLPSLLEDDWQSWFREGAIWFAIKGRVAINVKVAPYILPIGINTLLKQTIVGTHYQSNNW